ncbi:MAG: 7-carboxy-7-deazaguanine synthase [Pelotomaculum sp. PtaB.Bin104]|nr:MAG: 7-carboxy-7-deazaguanine synthase [Pelotomaculum sp. PtaB.Bin104]
MPCQIAEIFSSVQGEGLLVGCRQIFIRLQGCNINCSFCDTPVNESGFCKIEQNPGQKDFRQLPNPLSAEEVAAAVHSYDLSIHHSISLTGGEPLLWTSFIKELIPFIKGTRHGIYLETNGTLPEALSEVIEFIDIIGMDIKLPSISGLTPFWEEHRCFLKVAKKKQVFVKVVVGEDTTKEEIEQAAGLISDYGKSLTMIIQPVSPTAGGIKSVSPGRALYLQQLALKILANVLIIPQTHKIMGQL